MGLIGVGAHAVFTQNTVSAQTITAGTMNVTLSSTEVGVSGNNTATLTLPAVGPVNSSFTTGDQLVTITNNSNISVLEIESTPGQTNGGSPQSIAFAAEAYLCEVSSGEVIYNGLLSGAGPQAIAGTLAAGGTDNYSVNIYAGSEPTACGAVTAVGAPAVAGTSTAPSLDNSAEGGAIVPSMTVSYTG
jgi:predicted ribosomally synthesized peptide with SipW-like signal peptide